MLKSPFLNIDNNTFIFKVTCLCWVPAKLMCWRIWTTNRLLPTIPVWSTLDHLPPMVNTVLFTLSIIVTVILFFKTIRWLLAALIIVDVLLCALDVNRILPWEYLYLFIVFIFLVNKPVQIRACILVLLASTYFYSGLSKLNAGFIHTVWSNLILRFFRVSPDIVGQNWVHYCGYLPGMIELLAGIGLLFSKTRVKSALTLILTHLFILILFGPFGIKGYWVLWPWNASMIFFLVMIWNSKYGVVEIFDSLIIGWNRLIFVCWIILPFLGLFGWWQSNLSSNLFSGNVPRMVICIRDTSKCRPLQRFYRKRDIGNICNGQTKIDLQYWAISETRASAYPEPWAYKILQRKLEEQYAGAGLSFIYPDR